MEDPTTPNFKCHPTWLIKKFVAPSLLIGLPIILLVKHRVIPWIEALEPETIFEWAGILVWGVGAVALIVIICWILIATPEKKSIKIREEIKRSIQLMLLPIIALGFVLGTGELAMAGIHKMEGAHHSNHQNNRHHA